MTLYTLGGIAPKKKTIEARSGWEVPCEAPSLGMISVSTREIEIKASIWIGRLHGIEIRSISAHFYNCVGMVFAARRAWIEIDYVERLLVEDGYRPIPASDAMIGDVVLYRDIERNPTHVGLVVGLIGEIGGQRDFMVLSKWGLEAEFLHPVRSIPSVFGSPEYYTERLAPTGQYHGIR